MEGESVCTLLSGHVVICNVNAKIKVILEQLRCINALDIAIIIQDRELWERNPQWHPPELDRGTLLLLFGYPTDRELLKRACIAQARAAIILSDPLQGRLGDARSTLVAVAIERENPQVHTVMELLLSVNRSHLRATEVNEVICLGELTEKLLAQSCITPGSNRIFTHLLTTQSETNQIFLPQIPNSLEGLSWRELARRAIQCKMPYVVCGFVQNDPLRPHEGGQMYLNPRGGEDPGRDTILREKDQLIVIANHNPSLNPLTRCNRSRF